MAEANKSTLATKPPEMTILSDHPAEHSGDDFLRLESRLSVVLDILRHKNTKPPVTIAIYGDWGTGKTSAMHWLQSQLDEWNKVPKDNRKQHPRVHPVWFDPWKYHTREEVWRGIIAEVILSTFEVKKLDSENFQKRITGAAKKFGAFLGKSFLHALAHTELKVGEGAELTVSGEMFSDIFDEYDKANHPEMAHLNQFEDTLRSWIEEYVEDDARIVLFIDDLDRCLPEVTLEVLAAIKLYLAIPRIMFVVGLDREVVDGVVIQHYEKNGLGREKARQYLGKIFQVEIQIPPSEQQMHRFFDEQIKELKNTAGVIWEQNLKPDHRQILEKCIRELARHNPRETKRIINSALLRGRAAIDDVQLQTHHKGEYLFAQGIQFFLVQRIVQDRLTYGISLLRTNRFVKWIERWSKFERDYPGFIPESKEMEPNLTKKVLAAKEMESKGLTVAMQTEAEKVFNELKQDEFTGDDGKRISIELLLEVPVLRELLRIPFYADVAMSAPILELKKPEGLHASPKAESGIEDAIASMPSVLRDKIAAILKKPVAQLKLEDLQTVKELNLSATTLAGSDLAHLAKLTALSSLDLNKTGLEDKDMAMLPERIPLKKLTLDYTKITDETLAHLSKFKALEELDLSSTQVTNNGLVELAKQLRFKRLSLEGSKVTDAGIAEMAKLTILQNLYLDGTQITDKSTTELAKLPDLNVLMVFELGITDATVTSLTKMTQLKDLWILMPKLTDACVSDLMKFENLNQLTLAGSDLSADSISKLKKKIPNVNIF